MHLPHLPSLIDLPDCPYRRRHLHICQTRGNGTLELYAKTPDMTSTCKLHGPRVLPGNRSMRCAGPGVRETRPSHYRHPRSKGEAVASSQVMSSPCVCRVKTALNPALIIEAYGSYIFSYLNTEPLSTTIVEKMNAAYRSRPNN